MVIIHLFGKLVNCIYVQLIEVISLFFVFYSHIQMRSQLQTIAHRRYLMDDPSTQFLSHSMGRPVSLPNDSNYALAKSLTRVHSNFIVL